MKKITEVGKFLLTLLVLSGIFFVIFYIVFRPKQQQQQLPQPTASSQQTVKHKKVTDPRIKKLNLVGLGDSLTHGVGDTSQRGGYVYLIQQRLLKKDAKQVDAANFGKTGDTTNQIKTRLDQQPAIQNRLKKADVITITTGGNDLMHVLQANFKSLSSNHFSKNMTEAKDRYQVDLTALLTDVRAVNPTAPIFLFSVYDPFYVYFPNMTALQKYTDEWNQAAQTQASQISSAYFVDVNRQLSEGQYYGKSKTQLERKVNSDLSRTKNKNLEKILSDPTEKNKYLSPDDHFHPNDLGYQLMTNKLYQVMQKHRDSWLKESTNEN